MPANRRLVGLVPVLALVVACQSATPTAAPGSGGPTLAPGQSGGNATGEPSLPPGIVVGSGDFVLADPTAGLVALASHRSVLSVAFDGAEGVADWSTTVTLQAAGSPRVALQTIERTGVAIDGPFPDDPAWAAEVDGIAYWQEAGGACLAEAARAAGRALDEPAAALPPLIGATPNGSALVDGIETNAYTFDGLALGIATDTATSGTVSVAIDDGRVVRYQLTTSAGPDYFGDGLTGTMTVTYSLTDVGLPVTVDLPAGCPTKPIELLLPEDATKVVSVPGLLAYFTQASVKDAAGLVRATAIIARWTPVGTDALDVTFGHLAFEFEGVTLDVLISTEDGGTYVQIVGSRA